MNAVWYSTRTNWISLSSGSVLWKYSSSHDLNVLLSVAVALCNVYCMPFRSENPANIWWSLIFGLLVMPRDQREDLFITLYTLSGNFITKKTLLLSLLMVLKKNTTWTLMILCVDIPFTSCVNPLNSPEILPLSWVAQSLQLTMQKVLEKTMYASKSTNRPIILRIESQKKLREIKLRKKSIETIKQNIWVLIKAQKGEEIILEEKGKGTWILLQEVDKVLNWWRWIKGLWANLE